MDLVPLRTDSNALLAELRLAGAQIRNERAFKCPFHGGKHENAGIYQREDGVWRFKCPSGKCGLEGDLIDVQAWRLGKKAADVLKEMAGQAQPHRVPPVAAPCATTSKPAHTFASFDELRAAVEDNATKANQKVEAIYEYRNPTTKNLDLAVFRLAGADCKSFRQGHQSDAGFALSAPGGPLPLYNRSRLHAAARVVVVEGEKCVHALHAIGITATTSPGGSNGAQKADWSPLAGKQIVVWPDYDPEVFNKRTEKHERAGDKYAQAVIAALEALEPKPTIRLIDPAQLGLSDTGTDCVDYIATYKTATIEEKRVAVEAVLEFAEDLGPAGELFAELDDAIAGKRRPIKLPWPSLHKATKMLRPGKVIMLAGHPGATKSFWLLALLAYCAKNGVKVAIMELEDNRTYHLRRAFAQEAQVGHLTDDEWCEANPTAVKLAQEKHRAFVEMFGPCIDAHPTGEITVDGLTAWVQRKAEAGCKVLAIDPITAMDAGEKQWVADKKFLIKSKQIIDANGCNLILVTHPKTGTKTSGLGDMAGGASYARFCHTGLWLECNDPTSANFRTDDGERQREYNRLVQIRKARDGPGGGRADGFWFNPETFGFEELGFIVKEDKE